MMAVAAFAGAASLALGGVVVGSPIQLAVRAFGIPDIVQTTADGHLWQWTSTGGLDREVFTDDDMDVVRILVAVSVPAASPTSSPLTLPDELPVLGRNAADAADAAETAGAVPLPDASSSERAWLFTGGVLVERYADSKTISVTAMDPDQARSAGYLWPRPRVPDYEPPALVKQFITDVLPRGEGTTIVRVLIDAAGHVADTRVIVPSGQSAVDDWTIDCIRRSIFSPATCGGVPCPGVYVDVGGLSR
jgi:TonB family protein